jgi:hypothetical protein
LSTLSIKTHKQHRRRDAVTTIASVVLSIFLRVIFKA